MEDVELILPPAEPTEPVPQGKQPDKPTQTGEVNYQEILMTTLAQLSQKMEEIKTDNKQSKEELGQKMEENSKKAEENSKKMEEKMEENSKKVEENSKNMEEKMEEIKTDNKQSKEELNQISQKLRCV